MSENNVYADLYRQEAEELLSGIEAIVLDLEENTGDMEAVNHLFRSFHTIKGSGSMFGFDDIAEFTHHMENVLSKVRDRKVSVQPQLIDLILSARDHISTMLQSTIDGPGIDYEQTEDLVEAFKAYVVGNTVLRSEIEAPSVEIEEPEEEPNNELKNHYHIEFIPDRNTFTYGIEPASLFEEMRELGRCDVIARIDKIPPLETMNAEQCYLSWDIILQTDAGIEEINEVFIFVEDGSIINIKSLDESSGDLEGSGDAGPSQAPVSEEVSAIPERELEEVSDKTTGTKAIPVEKPAPADEIHVPGETVTQANTGRQDKSSPSENKNKGGAALKFGATTQTLRVSSERLDRLINLVGEMVITQARIAQIAGHIEHVELTYPVEELERLTGELRDNVLNIRMTPIGSTFKRFRRMVRDLSSELGKDVEMVTVGEETELDKSVIDKLGDPLLHLIRNSIDHGLETPEEREALGKPGKGILNLSARQRGADVVISIEDDGRGLDKDQILEKARSKGLITGEKHLSDKEIYNLIFHPGFSTAKIISSVSGRGVGMDVVKREIDSLRGNVDIISESGKGTTVSLTLPLTLAIIDGLLVEVGSERFVIPVGVVDECVEISRNSSVFNERRNVVDIRGELISTIHLRDIFSINSTRPEVENGVIVHLDEERVGIVVDRVIGDHQTVIKSLGKVYESAHAFSGSTILGDGSVALILDLHGVVRCAREDEEAAKQAIHPS